MTQNKSAGKPNFGCQCQAINKRKTILAFPHQYLIETRKTLAG